jgi:hypothetical protein
VPEIQKWKNGIDPEGWGAGVHRGIDTITLPRKVGTSDDVRQALIDALREGNGAELRALLKVLCDNDAPVARALYQKLIHDPALHDLVPH